MLIKCVIYACTLLCNVQAQLSETVVTSQPNGVKFTDLVEELFSGDGIMLSCTVQIFFFDNQTFVASYKMWEDKLSYITAHAHSDKMQGSGGITVSAVHTTRDPNDSSSLYYQPSVLHHSRRCSLVVVIMNKSKFTSMADRELKRDLNFPLLAPATIRNRDKYLILTHKDNVPDIHKSKFVQGLKFKLYATVSNIWNCNGTVAPCGDLYVSLKQLCYYGPSCFEGVYTPSEVSRKFDNLEIWLFPDHERNYFGHVLRLSTTTRVPQLLEMDIVKTGSGDSVKDIYLPRRGLYAKVLEELTERLNFTYEIIPSSGDGSTGHIHNGTWVGTVGDTYHGIVDFGYMAAITYSRFPYAEFCAPINYAYLGFATGPPKKFYTWKAILWPFTPTVWFCVVVSILIGAIVLSKTSNVSLDIQSLTMESIESLTRWSNLKGVSVLIRGLLEQCPDLPTEMSISYRLFLTVWLCFCLVFSTLYRSKMVSLLTFPVYDQIPKSFDEMATAHDFIIDFHYFGNVGYTYFKSSTNPTIMAINRKMGLEPAALKCMQRPLLEKAACIIFIITFEELLHRNLSDQYGKSPLKFTQQGDPFAAGVIHEHKAPLSVNFKMVLFPAMESGLIPLWQQEDLNDILQQKNRWQKANGMNVDDIWGDDKYDDSMLRVRNLQGAFAIFFLGMTASVCAFGVENTKLCAARLTTWFLSHFGRIC